MTRSTASFGVVEALAIADLESRRRLGPVQRATLAALRELRDRSREESGALACLISADAAGSRSVSDGHACNSDRPSTRRDAGRGLYEVRRERGRPPRLTQRPPLASPADRRS